MKYYFLLARRYILSHKIKTIILLTSISITLYLPVTVNILVPAGTPLMPPCIDE